MSKDDQISIGSTILSLFFTAICVSVLREEGILPPDLWDQKTFERILQENLNDRKTIMVAVGEAQMSAIFEGVIPYLLACALLSIPFYFSFRTLFRKLDAA